LDRWWIAFEMTVKLSADTGRRGKTANFTKGLNSGPSDLWIDWTIMIQGRSCTNRRLPRRSDDENFVGNIAARCYPSKELGWAEHMSFRAGAVFNETGQQLESSDAVSSYDCVMR
jgi:hypothetical protein